MTRKLTAKDEKIHRQIVTGLQQIRRKRTRVEEIRKYLKTIEKELNAEEAILVKKCPIHIDDGGFMYGFCKICGECLD